jgi:GNAT superfamily N-acetyltransferase
MHVRAMAPTDGENYRSILERTSDEDRYCRFFHVVDHFDPEFVEQYVVARPDILGFIAEEDGKPLGAAHAVGIDERSAELAIIVAQDARRRGVARALLTRLIAELPAHGYKELIAYALRENRAFSGLAKTVGMNPDPIDDARVTTWRLPVQRFASA